MAKKDSRRLNCYSLDLIEKNAETTEMTILGHNANGTKVEVTVSLDRFDLREISKKAIRVIKNRINSAKYQLSDVENALK